jgi:hypothetical protein
MQSYFDFRLKSLYLSIYEDPPSIAFPLWTLYIYLQHFSTGLRKPLTTFEGLECHSYNAISGVLIDRNPLIALAPQLEKKMEGPH